MPSFYAWRGSVARQRQSSKLLPSAPAPTPAPALPSTGSFSPCFNEEAVPRCTLGGLFFFQLLPIGF